MTSRITVIIPVRNEAATIGACIEGILEQTVRAAEIIVLDSRSTDGTREILRGFPDVRVIDIDPSEFNHGETRNIGVRAAEGSDFVLFTVGDARPADNQWVERLLAGFSDEEVAGVCGQQIVPRDLRANPLEWFDPVSAPGTYRHQFTRTELDALSPRERKWVSAWDNVTAMYRRHILLQIPFERVSYSEDMVWANAALRAGYALVYVTAARVFHFHTADPEFALKRTVIVGYMRYREFGDLPDKPGTIGNILRGAARLLTMRGLSLAEKQRWIRYNLRDQIALRKGVQLVRTAAERGPLELQRLYSVHSRTPPIPVKISAARGVNSG